MTKRAKAQYRRNRNKKIREQIFDILGRKCVDCGYDIDLGALCIEHKNGGGTQERRQRGGDYKFYILKQILAGSKEYQILCANCKDDYGRIEVAINLGDFAEKYKVKIGNHCVIKRL